jgi:hypothetical protein
MNIEEVLRTIPFQSINFGDMTVHIYPPEQLHEAQLGYSIHSDGTSLTGDEEGDWKRVGLSSPMKIAVVTQSSLMFPQMNCRFIPQCMGKEIGVLV